MGPGACAGGAFDLATTAGGFDATFSLFPSGYLAGGCQDPLFQSGCGVTEMAVDFSDDIYFSEQGLATFYLDRYSSIPGSPLGQFPDGTVAGQAWTSGIIQVAVGPGQPVHIGFSANWTGQCCVGGPDDALVRLSLSKIEFTNLSGNVSSIPYNAMYGVTWGAIDSASVPEPASLLLSGLGFGVLIVLGRRKVR